MVKAILKTRSKAEKHTHPLKKPAQATNHQGKACLKRKIFTCLWKSSKDGASLAPSGREFQSLGATEEDLLCPHQMYLWR